MFHKRPGLMTRYNIVFYHKRNGRMPVLEYIQDKSKEEKGRINRKLGLLELFGENLQMPHSKRLTKDIYELRPEGMRLFYFWSGKDAVFTNAIDKKDFRQDDIVIAEKRMKEL